MSRIFEHDLADEEDVVARTLAVVHKAIDEAFPHVGHASSKQFTATAFSVQEDTKADHHPDHHGTPSQPPSAPETQDSVPITKSSSSDASEKSAISSEPEPRSSAARSLAEYTALHSKPPSQFTNIEDSLSGVEGAFSIDESALHETDPDFRPIKTIKWTRLWVLLLIFAVTCALYFYDELRTLLAALSSRS